MLIQVHATCKYDKTRYAAIRVPNLLALLSYLYSTVDVDELRTTEPILIELPSKQGNKKMA